MTDPRTELDRQHRASNGSAAAMLVLVLALLVGTYAASVGRIAANERRNVSHQLKVSLLESAIKSVAESDVDGETRVRLPIDKASDRWVIVETVSGTDTGRVLEATLYHNENSGLSIQRAVSGSP
ncbi:hypothetical protein NHH03_26880 [Stieleria sp. TO1_6]|uniref:hypothetical protein n=1 Tax=Stieleria tagensis TaxID=2956795 RepID=UPI00209AD965|nr:hypothetical protein [Stieleria tagensis]MCO8125393.1 hypothetical protein [Stieleria tagensis]